MRLLQAARQSRSHDNGTTMDKQDHSCEQYAAAYDHQIIGVAADSDVSGKTDPFTRPDLGRWLSEPALIASYDGIIASHLDRFARSTRYMSKLLDWAEEHGKVIICVTPAVDFSTPVGKLIAFIMSWLAQEELALITKRSKDTQDYLKANGFLVGRPPYGFKVTAQGDHKTLTPEPAEAAHIRAAAARYLEGASLRAVCAWLDEQGSRPRTWTEKKPKRMNKTTGKEEPITWSPVSLSQVFRNESLLGRRMSVPDQDGNRRTMLKHQGILDRETWDHLQARLDEKAHRKGVAPAQTALLTSIAVCAKCGGPMYRINSGSKRKDGTRVSKLYYRCHGSDRSASTCANMVPLAELESWLDEQLRSNVGYVIETVVTPGKGHADEIAEAERDLRELDYDAPDFLDRQAALLAERARLRSLPSEPAKVEEQVAAYTVADLWGWLEPAERRAYLLAAGVKVVAASGQEPRIEGDPSTVAATGWLRNPFSGGPAPVTEGL